MTVEACTPRSRGAHGPHGTPVPREPQHHHGNSASTGSIARFIASQPAVDTIAPEASDDTPIVANTMKSFAPCTRAFSAGA